MSAMHATEVESFVRKFHQLWSSGLEAHLDLDCHGGVAWVGLRVLLDHHPGPAHHRQDNPSRNHRKTFSPAYQRRRERRAAEHAHLNEIEENAVKASRTENAEEASNAKVVEASNEKDVEVPKENAEEAYKVGENNDKSENVREILIVEAVEATEKNDNNVHEQTEEVAVEKIYDENNVEMKEIIEDELVDKDPSRADVVSQEEERPISQQPSNKTPDVIPVFCMATVENCPDSQLNEDYGNSIRRFLASEQHLEQNIVSTELQYMSSRSFRNNLHTHTVSIVLNVKTARLWESPASYVRKHLGISKYWERSTGTVIRLSRIHQR